MNNSSAALTFTADTWQEISTKHVMTQNCTVITADMTREFTAKGRMARHNSACAALGGLRYNERAKNDLAKGLD